MIDTPASVRELYSTLLMRRSGSERLKMGCDMFDTSRALVRAAATGKTQLPQELRVHIFLRTYGRDFDPATRARIVQRLAGQPIRQL